jgi:hypothetical protein
MSYSHNSKRHWPVSSTLFDTNLSNDSPLVSNPAWAKSVKPWVDMVTQSRTSSGLTISPPFHLTREGEKKKFSNDAPLTWKRNRLPMTCHPFGVDVLAYIWLTHGGFAGIELFSLIKHWDQVHVKKYFYCMYTCRDYQVTIYREGVRERDLSRRAVIGTVAMFRKYLSREASLCGICQGRRCVCWLDRLVLMRGIWWRGCHDRTCASWFVMVLQGGWGW